jgi:hypothetical protein
VAVVSFDNAYFYEDFSWIFKTAVDGNSYRWPNVSMGESILYMVRPYSIGHVENPIPAYGGVYVTGYDTVAPAIPSDLTLTAVGVNITAKWTENMESDFDGYEVAAKKTDIEFDPDTATDVIWAKKKGRENIVTFAVSSVGIWSVKIRAFDQSDPPNKSDWCDIQTINLLLPSKIINVVVKNKPLWVDPVSGVTFAVNSVDWRSSPAEEGVDLYEVIWGGNFSTYLYVGKAVMPE